MADDSPCLRFGPVTVWLGEKSGKYPDGNQVIVQGADTTVAFDTPLVSHRIGPAFDGVDHVILGHVHEDHMAGLARLPAHVPVQAHEADLAALQSWEGLERHYGYSDEVLAGLKQRLVERFFYRSRPGATGYADGTRWSLGGGVTVQAVHLPGHTSGHCALWVEPVGLAFIGDIDLSGFGPYYGDATSSLADFRRTLAQVATLPARTWVTSHHKGVITDRDTFDGLLRAFAARLDERDARLLQLLAAGPLTLDELVRQRLVYQPDQEELWIDMAEARMIGQHLDDLLAHGRVQATDDGRWMRVPGAAA